MEWEARASEEPETVMGTIPMDKRTWLVEGRMWKVHNGDHCTGCHRRGHMVGDCPLQPYIFPLDQYLDDKLPDGAEAWLVEVERQKGKGRQEMWDQEMESSQVGSI